MTDRGSFGPILECGSVLLVLPSSGELIAFVPNPTTLQILARLKVTETPVYAHPIVAGNRIYIKDEANVTLWTLP